MTVESLAAVRSIHHNLLRASARKATDARGRAIGREGAVVSDEFFYVDEAEKSDAAMHAEMLVTADSPETKARILANLRKRLTDKQIKAGWPDLLPD